MEDLSEKEQIEQIRTWWSEYGSYVIGGVVAGALALFGYNSYQNKQLTERLEASALYESLTEYVVGGDLEKAEATSGQLHDAYAGTAYDVQARLAMARLYMDRNRDQDAADVLRELLASDADAELKHVARVRLGRILLYQDKAQEAVELLEGQDSAAFNAIYNELLGDAYQALGRIADAEAAYQRVLMDPAAQSTVDAEFVQWKALDLPSTTAAAGAPEPQADAPVETTGPTDEESE